MALNDFFLTSAGRTMMAQAAAGTQVTITRAQIGEGVWPEGTSYDNITALVKPLRYLTIAKKTAGSEQAQITVQFSNAGIGRAFKWTEFALWAADPADPTNRAKDICLGTSYATTEEAKPIDAGLTEFNFNVVLAVSKSSNVTVVIDQSLVYVTPGDLDKAMEELRMDMAGIDMKITDKTTAKKYVWGMDNGLVYLEEVE